MIGMVGILYTSAPIPNSFPSKPAKNTSGRLLCIRLIISHVLDVLELYPVPLDLTESSFKVLGYLGFTTKIEPPRI